MVSAEGSCGIYFAFLEFVGLHQISYIAARGPARIVPEWMLPTEPSPGEEALVNSCMYVGRHGLPLVILLLLLIGSFLIGLGGVYDCCHSIFS